jgi:hypothetical protein
MIPAAVPVLLEAALRALLAACVLWTGLRLLRVKNVPAQKAAWGLVLVAALAMPLLMRWQWLPSWAEVKLPAPAWPSAWSSAGLRMIDAAPASAPADAATLPARSLVTPRVEIAQTPTGTGRYPAPSISVSQFDAPPQTGTESTPEASPVSAPVSAPSPNAVAGERTPSRLIAIGWLLYLTVGAALLLRLIMGLGSSLRLWIQARPVNCEFSRGLRVRASRRVASPVNIGSGILLPDDYAHWDEEKLRVVLAHESSHVRQRDFYLQLLAGLYAALIWFSPLGWWLKRKLSELGEAISDRAALEAAASPSAYAQLLLEFAALPRPTLTGVAMAHSTNLSHRIERLLNDSSFRQAFAGRRRALAALLLVPVALLAGTAFVHVQAAEVAVARPSALLQGGVPSSGQSSNAAPAQTGTTGQSHPDEAQVTSQDSRQAAPQPNSAPTPAPPSDSTESVPTAPDAPGEVAPAPPPSVPSQDAVPPVPPVPPSSAVAPVPPAPPAGHGYRYEYHYGDGDAYAIVGDSGDHVRFSGSWDGDQKVDIDKARSMAHGHFLWFRRDGKSYIVDDPAIVANIEAMRKPMDDLGAQMRDMGKQMREAGQEAREAARKARAASQNIPTPDLSKELADLNAAAATIQAQAGATITREQLREIQRKVEEVQRKLINVQIKVDVNWNGDMSKVGREQGDFGAKMGELGAEMGRIGHENHEKVESIIDECLKNGKARPVE